MPLEVQDRQSDDGGEDRGGEPAERPGEKHRHAGTLQDREGVGPQPEERGGGKRRITRQAADDVPRQRQRRIHGENGGQAQRVIAAEDQPGETRGHDGKNDERPHS